MLVFSVAQLNFLGEPGSGARLVGAAWRRIEMVGRLNLILGVLRKKVLHDLPPLVLRQCYFSDVNLKVKLI